MSVLDVQRLLGRAALSDTSSSCASSAAEGSEAASQDSWPVPDAADAGEIQPSEVTPVAMKFHVLDVPWKPDAPSDPFCCDAQLLS